MDSSDLRPEQARRIVAAVGPALGYVCKLAHRMEQLGWKADDPMYVAAWKSYDALHTLHILAHYAGCGLRGAGQPGAPPGQQPPTPPPTPGAT